MNETTFAALWRQAVAEHGDAMFLRFEDADEVVTEWTYAEFDSVVDGVAATLTRHGVVPGAPVHLALGNCPAFVAVWLAAARLGAWIIPADPRGSAAEFADQLTRTRAVLGICATARAAEYRCAATQVGLPSVLELAEDATDCATLHTEPGTPEYPDPAPLDRLAVMFTSGTTARPKGVVLTQRLYAFTAEVMAQTAALEPGHRWLVTLPLFHANAQYYCFASAIKVGAGVALMARFSATRWLEQAQRHEVSHASLFAAPLRMVLARGNRPAKPLSLRHVWFAQNVTASQYQEFACLVGCQPRQLYGMTETGPAVLSDTSADVTPDSIGVPAPGCAVRIAGSGELEVGGVPGHTLFPEYLDDPATTEKAFHRTDSGQVWFRTGDRVTRDAGGRYRFAGRGGDIIKVGGENISLTEVEAALAEHPGLFEVAAVAAPDETLDEVVVAFAVPADTANPPSIADLDAFGASRLAPARRPRAWHLVDELPRTSVGKIRRFQLTERAREY